MKLCIPLLLFLRTNSCVSTPGSKVPGTPPKGQLGSQTGRRKATQSWGALGQPRPRARALGTGLSVADPGTSAFPSSLEAWAQQGVQPVHVQLRAFYTRAQAALKDLEGIQTHGLPRASSQRQLLLWRCYCQLYNDHHHPHFLSRRRQRYRLRLPGEISMREGRILEDSTRF